MVVKQAVKKLHYNFSRVDAPGAFIKQNAPNQQKTVMSYYISGNIGKCANYHNWHGGQVSKNFTAL